jgi:hypothetical protein
MSFNPCEHPEPPRRDHCEALEAVGEPAPVREAAALREVLWMTPAAEVVPPPPRYSTKAASAPQPFPRFLTDSANPPLDP